MSFLGGILGNASRVDPAAAAREYRRLLADGEQVHAAYSGRTRPDLTRRGG